MTYDWLCSMGMALTLSFSATGCWVDTIDNYDNYDEVVTVRDEKYNYSVNKTYAMPEKIFDFSALVEDGTGLYSEYDELVLGEIAEQMGKLGYDRIADPRSDEADVILAVGAVVEEDGAYGYYYWYDYFYYYPSVSVSVSYEVGTLIIVMIDPKRRDDDFRTLPVVWAAGLTGVMYSHSNSQIREALNQAFAQSPYLEVGPSVPAEPGLTRPDAGSLDTLDGNDTDISSGSDTDTSSDSVGPDGGLITDAGGA